MRDRKPFVRFTGKAYVLPKTGQQGIPVVSVNTPAVAINVYRIGDRNLLNTVLGSDFQRTLNRYESSTSATNTASRSGPANSPPRPTLNQDVTTAFPVDQALGELQPGVYAMLARPKGQTATSDGALATQWFIVSDLGLSAYSGNDGIHVFVHSLASTDRETPKCGCSRATTKCWRPGKPTIPATCCSRPV